MEILMNKWQILLDVGMLGLIAFITFIGIKQGFVKSFFKYMKLTIVIIITMILGVYLVSFVQDNVVADRLDGRVQEHLVAKAENFGEAFDYDEMIEGLPSLVKKVASMKIIRSYFDSLTGSTVEVARSLGRKIEAVLADVISKIIAYGITFFIVYVLCTIGVFFLEKACEIPILHGFDKVLGFVWGISHAYAFVSLLVCVVMIIVGVDFIEGTKITRLIYKFGLFTH